MTTVETEKITPTMGSREEVLGFLYGNAAGLGIPPAWVHRRMDDFRAEIESKDNLVLVSRGGSGGITGVVILKRGQKHSDQHIADLRIYVVDKHRGRGAGSALLKRALEWAREEGVERINATPYNGNRSVYFFERNGFQIEGIAHKGAKNRGGELVDVVLLAAFPQEA